MRFSIGCLALGGVIALGALVACGTQDEAAPDCADVPMPGSAPFGGELDWVARAGNEKVDCDPLTDQYCEMMWSWDVIALPGGGAAATGFAWAATFGSGESGEQDVEPDGAEDAFVASFLPDGSLGWVRSAGTDGDNPAAGLALTLLHDCSVVVAGTFEKRIVFDEGRPTERVLTESSGGEAFLARYAENGDLIWAVSFGGDDSDEPFGTVTLADGTILVWGEVADNAVFGEGEPGETTLTGDNWLRFTARYDIDGRLIWAREGHAGDAKPVADGGFVVTSRYDGTVTIGPGEPNETTLQSDGGYNVLVARFDAEGDLIWARSDGASPDFDAMAEPWGLAAGEDGSTVVIGTVHQWALFGEGEDAETEISTPLTACFLAGYTLDGQLAWVESFDVPDFTVRAVDGFADGSALLAGYYNGAVTFGAGTANETTLDTSGGGGSPRNAFLARYGPDGSLIWAKQIAKSGNFSYGYGVAAGPEGSSLITGRYCGAAKFGAGEAGEVELLPTGLCDIYVAELGR